MKARTIAILLLCTYMALGAAAQTAVSIKSFTQTTDHIPSGDRRNDLNGTPCALVKVQVVDEIERIEGNKIGEIVNHGVEKWVYMCKGSRNMRIHFKNHLPVKITFRDYKVNGLESNRVYELILSTPDQPTTNTTVEVKGNYLQMKVTPNNAMVTIWGDHYQRQVHRAQSDGTLRVYLPYGRYHYSAKAKGFNDLEGSVFVNDENRWEEVRLGEIMGSLIVECDTKNVEFLVNGKKLDKDPKAVIWTGSLAPGEYIVGARKKGYITKTEVAVINANQITTVNFDHLITETEQRILERKKQNQEKKEQKKLAKAAKLSSKESENTAPTKGDNPATNKTITDVDTDDIYNIVPQPVKPVPQRTPQKSSTKKEKTLCFGLRAGVNLASLELSSDVNGSCSMVTSFHAGVNMDVRFVKQLHLNVGLLYSQKGYEYESDYYRQETCSSQFIMLPVQLSYRIGIVQINAGPYVEYGIGGEIEYGRQGRIHDTFDYYDALNYGITAGAGMTIAKHFFLGVNYEMGLSDYANQNIAISLGYNF